MDTSFVLESRWMSHFDWGCHLLIPSKDIRLECTKYINLSGFLTAISEIAIQGKRNDF